MARWKVTWAFENFPHLKQSVFVQKYTGFLSVEELECTGGWHNIFLPYALGMQDWNSCCVFGVGLTQKHPCDPGVGISLTQAKLNIGIEPSAFNKLKLCSCNLLTVNVSFVIMWTGWRLHQRERYWRQINLRREICWWELFTEAHRERWGLTTLLLAGS